MTKVNACVKKLLALFHYRYLWLDTKVPITVDLTSQITGLTKVGVDPMQYSKVKDSDKNLVAKLKKKYGVVKDT